MPADRPGDQEADLRTELLHARAHHSRDSAESPWNIRVEPLLCAYSPLSGNRRLSQFVEQRLGFFKGGRSGSAGRIEAAQDTLSARSAMCPFTTSKKNPGKGDNGVQKQQAPYRPTPAAVAAQFRDAAASPTSPWR